MAIKNFKFVSPGVFINEIDNSRIPKTPTAIGPVIVGRSRKGLAMQPAVVSSYDEYTQLFGETVPGSGGGDIYRDGNYQSPMYGTYAAKAFLSTAPAPVTFIRLLGQETTAGATAGGDAAAGWSTTNLNGALAVDDISVGGAYGLWIFPSGSGTSMDESPAQAFPGRDLNSEASPSAGVLAAVWYMDSGSIELSGFKRGTYAAAHSASRGTCVCIGSDTSGVFTTIHTDSDGVEHTVKFSLDDDSDTFIRNRFNTNPQLLNASGTFYPNSKPIWLGETFEENVRNYLDSSGASLVGQEIQGAIFGIQLSGSTTSPASVKQASREAVAGWFIGQDLSGNEATYVPQKMPKLFRLKGRGHGEWLHKNVKVSIERIKISSSRSNPYGTFSVVLRQLGDNDRKTIVLERFDQCTLDPSSPNYIARVIGDTYLKWNSTQRRLEEFGTYNNESKYIYVEMNSDVDAGASDALLLPFGYFGPPVQSSITADDNTDTDINSKFVSTSDRMPAGQVAGRDGAFLLGAGGAKLSATLHWPVDRLRLSASDGGGSDPTDAYFGLQVGRTSTSVVAGKSVSDWHRLQYSSFPDDPTSTGELNPSAISGFDAWSYVFSLDDIVTDASSNYFYQSGSRAGTDYTAYSYETLLSAGYDRFTAPFWGGFDGFNIKNPDPLYNKAMSSTSTEDNSSVYHTYHRAIDTVADPESLNMNLLAVPGLTNNALTEHMISTCESRGDALAVVDLPDVYIPSHESYYNSLDQRVGTSPSAAATALRNRRLDSSYGCTFYPWVQTQDASTGASLWIPPSVAMMGVMASTESSNEVWFAPAGFNRGGLSDGAAGIPVTNVSERLTSDNRDTLYEARINPIASFPSTGLVVFGQKTLQERQSALDRINVRRMVIFLKKQISILSNQVLFEQNTQATWNSFKALIEPLLSNTLTGYGITDYKLILDETTTTPDLIDQNILYAKIMVKPARAIEFIAIDFSITSTGASFDD